jgi:hypothetical protein
MFEALEVLISNAFKDRSIELATRTIAISFNNTSRCCSNSDFSAGGAFVEDVAGGRRVVLDILMFWWG